MKKKSPRSPSQAESKRFIALARVSSREQAREGFSLDVQETALIAYAQRHGGQIVRLFRVAETASKSDERKTFREMLEYARKNAEKIDGILVYKIDRAARNLFDYIELERVESVHDVPLIAISQPTENTPSGRMHRRVLASMASFYTEQQSLDVREGLAKRAQAGLFVGMTPYGYRNQRQDGRSIVVVEPREAANVRRIFDLYAHHHLTIDGIIERLKRDNIIYRPANPDWARSKVHVILRDRAYIGEIKYHGQWHPGVHEPIVDRAVWQRVQTLMGERVYKAHELTYAGGLIRCGHCGNLITGESVIKKKTGKEYIYYRCTMYNAPGHPNVRLPERRLDEQMLEIISRLRQPDAVRHWFVKAIRLWSQDKRQESRENAERLQRELTVLRQQEDRLLNLRLLDEINADTFAAKGTELRDRIAATTLQIEAADRGRAEQADLAVKVFELSQHLKEKWLTADFPEKRRICEMLFLNLRLDGATLCAEMNKPFDMLAEGLSVPSSRGDRI
jgi:site-specific DNA recombinase